MSDERARERQAVEWLFSSEADALPAAEIRRVLQERFGVTIGRSYISELERSWQKNKMPSMEVGRALAQAVVKDDE